MDWVNSVDATYQSDLRDLNELKFARFDAKLEQRFAEQREVLANHLAAFESRMTRWREVTAAEPTIGFLSTTRRTWTSNVLHTPYRPLGERGISSETVFGRREPFLLADMVRSMGRARAALPV